MRKQIHSELFFFFKDTLETYFENFGSLISYINLKFFLSRFEDYYRLKTEF